MPPAVPPPPAPASATNPDERLEGGLLRRSHEQKKTTLETEPAPEGVAGGGGGPRKGWGPADVMAPRNRGKKVSTAVKGWVEDSVRGKGSVEGYVRVKRVIEESGLGLGMELWLWLGLGLASDHEGPHSRTSPGMAASQP